MTLEELKEQIVELLNDMQDYALAYLWNEYCLDVRYYEDQIYTMDMIDDLFSGLSPIEVLDKFGRDFDTSADFWKDTIYGPETISDVAEEIDMEALVDWIIEQGKVDDCDINDLLDEYNNQEEE